MKKNIMLIAITTLTIAVANAGYNWQPVYNLQIVNNTNVTLEGRTEPDNKYFTLAANTSMYVPSIGNMSTYLGWGIDSSSNIPPSHDYEFDDPTLQQGTLSSTFAVISGTITHGQVWALDKVGYDDKLVFTGTASGNTMQLTATRTRGVVVERAQGSYDTSADFFCLSTGVEFSLGSIGEWGRCPVGESDVVIANDDYIQDFNSVDAWAQSDLRTHISIICNGNITCWNNPIYDPQTPLPGVEVYNVDQIAYTSTYQMLYIGI